MSYTEQSRMKSHGIRIESREKAFISGVDDVDNFNEGEINMVTAAGYLTLTGSDMHITRLNLDEGQVVVEGNVDGMKYSLQEDEHGGLFGRLFK